MNAPSSTASDSVSGGEPLRGLRQELTAELTLGLLHKINNLLTRIHFQVEDCQAILPEAHPVSAQIADLSENIRSIQALLDRTSQINLPPSEQDDGPIYDLEASIRQQLDLLKILLPLSQIRSVSEEALSIQPGICEGEFGLLLLQIGCALRAAPIPKRSPVFIDLLRGDQLQIPVGNLPWPPRNVAAVLLEAETSTALVAESPAAPEKARALAETLGCRILYPPCGEDSLQRILLFLPDTPKQE